MPEPGGAEAFYDRLAEHFHLIFEDWREGGRRQVGVLVPLLEAAAGGGPVRTLLDATCGIGTQAIPLAERGIEVRGSDLSEAALARARAEADAAGVSIELSVADVRDLDRSRPVDAVVSLDNSLPHLLEDGDLDRAIASMAACARPGGAVVVSVRDYEVEVGTELVRLLGEPPDRRAVVTLWHWLEDGVVYRLDHLVLQESEAGWTLVTAGAVRFRAYKRPELVAAFERAGLRDVRWLTAEDSGYYQPLVVGSKP